MEAAVSLVFGAMRLANHVKK